MRERGASTLAESVARQAGQRPARGRRGVDRSPLQEAGVPARPAESEVGAGTVGLRRGAVRRGVRGRAGRARVRVAHRSGRIRPRARSDPGAQSRCPGVTGYVCTRLCQTRCTRNDYEESVAIRALKRIAEERGRADYVSSQKPPTGTPGGVVGSGPSGLAAAAFLALNGVSATIFEAKDVAGGMMRTVPPFRLPGEIIQRDIDRITGAGCRDPAEHARHRSARRPAPAGLRRRLPGRGLPARYAAAGAGHRRTGRDPGVVSPRSVAPWRARRSWHDGGRHRRR